MEESYRASLVKSFKKQVDDGYFSFIMVDCINDKTSHYQEMWSYAKQRGFEVKLRTFSLLQSKEVFRFLENIVR